MQKTSNLLSAMKLFLIAALFSATIVMADTAKDDINKIDSTLRAVLAEKNIKPSENCSDAVFIRRVFLDVNGSLPKSDEVRNFLRDKKPGKRAKLIDDLLGRDEYADYWSMKWCDLLRVKAEFPINLWPNAVQAYHRWIHDALQNNMGYDQFARELLTSSGSNFRTPQVNFYRAIQGQEPATIADAACLTFMGIRLKEYSEKQQNGMEAFFSQVAYKSTAEWKEEIVYSNLMGEKTAKGVFLDGTTVWIKPAQDGRQIFAKWLIDGENKWFARNIVNRIWSWMFGSGIITPADDIRPDSVAICPELLTYLEKELVKSGWDIKHIYRLILNSETYQQSAKSKGHPKAEQYFACYPVRQLEAEVLIDALCGIFGSSQGYTSAIPEPFTFIPGQNRAINLADGSITNSFLEMFGRPSRDTGTEAERNSIPSDKQRMYLLNSTQVQGYITKSWRLKNLMKTARRDNRMLVDMLYMNILSRYPTTVEFDTVKSYFKTKGLGKTQAVHDLAWALVNSKEFLLKH
jgi:hypothetical protein